MWKFPSLQQQTLKNWKRDLVKGSCREEVYTASGVQVHLPIGFWLAFWYAFIEIAKHTRASFMFHIVLESFKHQAGNNSVSVWFSRKLYLLQKVTWNRYQHQCNTTRYMNMKCLSPQDTIILDVPSDWVAWRCENHQLSHNKGLCHCGKWKPWDYVLTLKWNMVFLTVQVVHVAQRNTSQQ